MKDIDQGWKDKYEQYSKRMVTKKLGTRGHNHMFLGNASRSW